MNNDELLEEFRQFSIDKGRSLLTIRDYLSDIAQFLDWIGDVDNIEKVTLIKYADYLEKKVVKGATKKTAAKTMNPNSIKRKLISVKQLIKFLNLEKEYNIKVTNKNINTSLRAYDDFITNKDVKRMIAWLDNQIDLGTTEGKKNRALRNKAVILGMYYTGARESELLQIKTVDAKSKWITVKGKGNIYRELYIPKKLSKILSDYAKTQDGGEYLFPITAKTVYDIVNSTGNAARGIKSSLAHPHALRNLYRQNLTKMGIRPEHASQLMGHVLSIEERYARVTKSELYAMIEKMDIDKLVKMK